jgi:hypothetical protein
MAGKMANTPTTSHNTVRTPQAILLSNTSYHPTCKAGMFGDRIRCVK